MPFIRADDPRYLPATLSPLTLVWQRSPSYTTRPDLIAARHRLVGLEGERRVIDAERSTPAALPRTISAARWASPQPELSVRLAAQAGHKGAPLRATRSSLSIQQPATTTSRIAELGKAATAVVVALSRSLERPIRLPSWAWRDSNRSRAAAPTSRRLRRERYASWVRPSSSSSSARSISSAFTVRQGRKRIEVGHDGRVARPRSHIICRSWSRCSAVGRVKAANRP